MNIVENRGLWCVKWQRWANAEKFSEIRIQQSVASSHSRVIHAGTSTSGRHSVFTESNTSGTKSVDIYIKGMRPLSKNAVSYLEEKPTEAGMAIVVAIETAARLSESDDSSQKKPALTIHDLVVTREHGPEMIGVTEAARRIGVSRTTIYDWVEKKLLLAWKTTRRGLVIPEEQICGPGKVVTGISDVLKSIPNPELAWIFLSEPWPFANSVERPIDKLKAGEVQEVIGTAPSYGSTFL